MNAPTTPEFLAWQARVEVIRLRARLRESPSDEEGYHPHIGHRPHDTAARRIKEGDPFAAGRACLCCDRTFLSEGPWNRKCPRCKDRQYRMPPVALPTARYVRPRYKETLQC